MATFETLEVVMKLAKVKSDFILNNLDKKDFHVSKLTDCEQETST